MLDTKILKNEEKAVFALRALYRQYGYLPYKMSKFESYEYYIQNKDFLVSDRIITFNDTNGRLLALKPDVTLSIIKNGEDIPGCKQKVYYNENVYRVSENTHQFKEIMQAGLECIGDIDLYDIFEAVSLAAQSLALISKDFVLQISHLGILSSVLERICPDAIFRQKVIGCIKSKNPHDLSRICREYGVEDTLLVQLVSAYGPRDKVLAKLETLGCGQDALQELQTLSKLLDQLPWADQIVFDFSVVNNMNYYNGIVFQGFLSGIFESVLAGGQYDKLMQKLERRAGAVGFAVYLDLLEQLPAEDAEYDVDVLLVYAEDTDKMAVAKAVAELTSQGKTVSTQKSIPEKLRYRQILKLTKEGALC
ncbi:MAG: ATP phosphoribosyltransferase regulatory subunit [Oscillospiraceae bacterium]|nr:ATP phosphoribosyltransferase regulatory subunit [Oscillospiraceae bacterium]